MSTQHTPTPWVARPIQYMNSLAIWGERRNIAGVHAHSPMSSGPQVFPDQDQAEANAAFIVRACNSHDALVAALRMAEALLAETPPSPITALARIRAAIAQAEGK